MSDYREHPPSPGLAAYVRCFWTHREDPERPRTRRVVPDACLDLVFLLHGPADAPDALVVGTMTTPLPVHTEGPTDLLGVRFHPGAAAALLRPPVWELTDRSVGLDEIWGSGHRHTSERLAALPPGPSRLAALEALLRRRLSRAPGTPDPAVRAAVALLEDAGGTLPVQELADAVDLGRRQLGRRFRDAVGIPPKTTARVLRFQTALRHLRADRTVGLSRVALRAGYHDQSHFTREFTVMAGEPPGAYRRSRPGTGPGGA